MDSAATALALATLVSVMDTLSGLQEAKLLKRAKMFGQTHAEKSQ